MNKTPDDHLEITIQPSARCGVAYTLGNFQPVRCTIIGDQPLFYMDFESDMIEDEVAAFDDKFAFAGIEKSLLELREKISTLDNASAVQKDAGLTMSQLYDDAAYIAHRVRRAADWDAVEQNALLALQATLRKSRLAAAYLDFGATFGLTMRYTRQTATAQYDRNGGIILINPDIDRADQILSTARELRRAWQHRNGALLHPLTFPPDQAILVNRAQIADLSVAMVRIGWELQLAGEKEAWDRLESSSMGDMARAFARESYLDFRTLNNGTAACAVFETWFLSDRCRFEDRKLIQQMLADYRGYVFESGQPAQQITVELVGALGTMPFGKNYLAPYVQTIISDAVFTEVRDRSNANFLWFIKFERSFRETEQELQKHELQKQGRQSGLGLRNKDKTSGNTAEIITLAGYAPLTGGKDERRAAGGAQIIVFRGGPQK